MEDDQRPQSCTEGQCNCLAPLSLPMVTLDSDSPSCALLRFSSKEPTKDFWFLVFDFKRLNVLKVYIFLSLFLDHNPVHIS